MLSLFNTKSSPVCRHSPVKQPSLGDPRAGVGITQLGYCVTETPSALPLVLRMSSLRPHAGRKRSRASGRRASAFESLLSDDSLVAYGFLEGGATVDRLYPRSTCSIRLSHFSFLLQPIVHMAYTDLSRGRVSKGSKRLGCITVASHPAKPSAGVIGLGSNTMPLARPQA